MKVLEKKGFQICVRIVLQKKIIVLNLLEIHLDPGLSSLVLLRPIDHHNLLDWVCYRQVLLSKVE